MNNAVKRSQHTLLTLFSVCILPPSGCTLFCNDTMGQAVSMEKIHKGTENHILSENVQCSWNWPDFLFFCWGSTQSSLGVPALPRSYSLARHLISCLVPAVIKVNLQLCSHYYLLYFLTNAENLPCIDAPIRPLHTTANTLLHFCHWWFKNVHFFHFSNSVIFWEVHQVVLF